METIKNKKGKVTSYREKIYVNGKAESKAFKRKSDAKAWKKQTSAEYQKMKALGINLKSCGSFTDFLKQWIQKKERQNLQPRTIEAYLTIINKYLIPLFGTVKLTNIQLDHAHRLIEHLLDNGLSTTRTNYILKRFKMILNDSVKWNYLVKNPLLNLEYQKVDPREKAYWTMQEANNFLQCNKFDENFSLYLVALNTGLRRGEIFGLCWDCVDFNNKKLIIKRQLSREGLKETTKSRKSREIQVNVVVIKELQKLKKECRSDTYVFTKRNGAAHDPTHFGSRVFKKAVQNANVKQIRFHDLRTTFASNWCMEGGDVFALSKVLGHSNIATTIKSYATLHPDFMAKVSEKFEFSLQDSPNIAHGNLSLVQN